MPHAYVVATAVAVLVLAIVFAPPGPSLSSPAPPFEGVVVVFGACTKGVCYARASDPILNVSSWQREFPAPASCKIMQGANLPARTEACMADVARGVILERFFYKNKIVTFAGVKLPVASCTFVPPTEFSISRDVTFACFAFSAEAARLANTLIMANPFDQDTIKFFAMNNIALMPATVMAAEDTDTFSNTTYIMLNIKDTTPDGLQAALGSNSDAAITLHNGEQLTCASDEPLSMCAPNFNHAVFSYGSGDDTSSCEPCGCLCCLVFAVVGRDAAKLEFFRSCASMIALSAPHGPVRIAALAISQNEKDVDAFWGISLAATCFAKETTFVVDLDNDVFQVAPIYDFHTSSFDNNDFSAPEAAKVNTSSAILSQCQDKIVSPAFGKNLMKDVVVIAIYYDRFFGHAWRENYELLYLATELPVLNEILLHGVQVGASRVGSLTGPKAGQPVQAFIGKLPYGEPMTSMYALARHLLKHGIFPGKTNNVKNIAVFISNGGRGVDGITPLEYKPDSGKSVKLNFRRITAAEKTKAGFAPAFDVAVCARPLAGEKSTTKGADTFITSVPKLAVNFFDISGDKTRSFPDGGAKYPDPVPAPPCISSKVPNVWHARDLFSGRFIRNTFFIAPSKQFDLKTATQDYQPSLREGSLYEFFPFRDGGGGLVYNPERMEPSAIPNIHIGGLGVLVHISFTWHSTGKKMVSGRQTQLNVPGGEFAHYQLRHIAFASMTPQAQWAGRSIHYTGCTPDRNTGLKPRWYYISNRDLVKAYGGREDVIKLNSLTIAPDELFVTIDSTERPRIHDLSSKFAKNYPDLISACPGMVLAQGRDNGGQFLVGIFVFICDFETWENASPSGYTLPKGFVRDLDLMAFQTTTSSSGTSIKGSNGTHLKILPVYPSSYSQKIQSIYLAFPARTYTIIEKAAKTKWNTPQSYRRQVPRLLHNLLMLSLSPFSSWPPSQNVEHDDYSPGFVHDPRYPRAKLNAGMSWATSKQAHSQHDVRAAALRKRGGKEGVRATFDKAVLHFKNAEDAGLHMMRCRGFADSVSNMQFEISYIWGGISSGNKRLGASLAYEEARA
jgi:hypothetical protein